MASNALALQELEAKAADCTDCELAKGRTNVVFGRGSHLADLMLIGEGPGAEEDEQGLPFVGRSGRLLQKILDEQIPDVDVYICNMVKCRPPNNRAPLAEEIQSCSSYLTQQIQLVAPKVIMTLGNSATKPLLKTEEGITKTRGQKFEMNGCIVIPTFHPAAILRDPSRQKYLRQDIKSACVELFGR